MQLQLREHGQPGLCHTRHRSGKLENAEDVYVVKGETSRSHGIDEKDLPEELGSSDRSGKLDNLTPVLSKLKMDQGNLMSETAQVHTQ